MYQQNIKVPSDWLLLSQTDKNTERRGRKWVQMNQLYKGGEYSIMIDYTKARPLAVGSHWLVSQCLISWRDFQTVSHRSGWQPQQSVIDKTWYSCPAPVRAALTAVVTTEVWYGRTVQPSWDRAEIWGKTQTSTELNCYESWVRRKTGFSDISLHVHLIFPRRPQRTRRLSLWCCLVVSELNEDYNDFL